MDRTEVFRALRAVGTRLEGTVGSRQVSLYLGGAVAGMTVGGFDPARVTLDCDILEVRPDSLWAAVRDAARAVAEEQGLPRNWLDRESAMFRHLLPLGWHDRLVRVDRFGPLEVHVISRIDLMAMKLVGAPVRPQDLEDLRAMKPTREDTELLREHLDRLEAESLDPESFESPRAILRILESDRG
jgi:hypothetical protein